MKSRSHLRALAALLVGMAAAPLFAQTFTYNNAGGDGLWSTPANWSGSLAYPDAVGALATMSTGSGFSTVLDVNATVSGLRNTAGSARIWTHTTWGASRSRWTAPVSPTALAMPTPPKSAPRAAAAS